MYITVAVKDFSIESIPWFLQIEINCKYGTFVHENFLYKTGIKRWINISNIFSLFDIQKISDWASCDEFEVLHMSAH